MALLKVKITLFQCGFQYLTLPDMNTIIQTLYNMFLLLLLLAMTFYGIMGGINC